MSDSGSSAVETAIVFPGLLLVVIMFFQFGLVAYAHHVVANATQDAAVDAATGSGSSVNLLASIDGIATSANVSVTGSNGDQVTTEGYATVISILPLFPEITVRASGHAAVEKFRPEVSR